MSYTQWGAVQFDFDSQFGLLVTGRSMNDTVRAVQLGSHLLVHALESQWVICYVPSGCEVAKDCHNSPVCSPPLTRGPSVRARGWGQQRKENAGPADLARVPSTDSRSSDRQPKSRPRRRPRAGMGARDVFRLETCRPATWRTASNPEHRVPEAKLGAWK